MSFSLKKLQQSRSAGEAIRAGLARSWQGLTLDQVASEIYQHSIRITESAAAGNAGDADRKRAEELVERLMQIAGSASSCSFTRAWVFLAATTSADSMFLALSSMLR
jgi:hypothetical protein